MRAVLSPMYVVRSAVSHALNSAKNPIEWPASGSGGGLVRISARRIGLFRQPHRGQGIERTDVLEGRRTLGVHTVRVVSKSTRILGTAPDVLRTFGRMFAVVGHRLRGFGRPRTRGRDKSSQQKQGKPGH